MCGGGGGAIVVGAIPGLGREAVLAVGPRGIRPGTIGPGVTPVGRIAFVWPWLGPVQRGGACIATIGAFGG